MKVYACPEACPAPKPDYRNYDFENDRKREEQHKSDLKRHLIEMGYTGRYTGEIVSFGVADGAAQYMLADGKGRYGQSFLVHLPYGDAYHYRGIEHFPKKAIIEQIERDRKFAALWAKRA